MSEGIVHAWEDPENFEVAYGVVRSLCRAMAETEIIPVGAFDSDEAVTQMLRQHRDHIDYLCINQLRVDVYKIACWAGCRIIAQICEGHPEDEDALEAASSTLVRFLAGTFKMDTEIVVPNDTQILLKRYLVHEFQGNGDHGIGQNGLYAAFHTAVAIAQSSKPVLPNVTVPATA